ncbi:class A beta-lactamase [Asticcacaulis sp. EMRT-3]|uniref:class A beta-lactamase n=1 Tax=Asticcacaulis sp. EMRT-3 TaxID=3040349 RepID=UPI0024AE974F|nr:class A beta-lactamase [Asticcacaulis sp. EMRT-3]MDI7775056.1 class A beta-lactamase [Asticcacaulis sp. EMRT-3]
MTLSRRGLLAGTIGLGLFGGLAACSSKVTQAISFARHMVKIERRHGGRIGVAALRGSDKKGRLDLDADRRFAHCSTFKWVLAAAILHMCDQGHLSLSKIIRYGEKDLLDYAPVTRQHVKTGHMTVAELCAAAIGVSDNTAANLLLGLVGGPAGLTAFVRGLGDDVTRFDRFEPTLNTNLPGDDRDTTTPAAMAGLLRTVFTGTALKPDSVAQLKDWMVHCQTGDKRIRAGVPAGALVADKTGTGANGAANDVAVIWPEGQAEPVFLAIYTSGGNLDDAGRDQTIADITRLVFDTLGLSGTAESSSSQGSQ